MKRSSRESKFMSHLIVKPYDQVFTPEGHPVYRVTWHGLETPVKGKALPTSGEGMEHAFSPIFQCGFRPDTDVAVNTIPSELADELGDSPVKGWKLLLADLRARGLGVQPLHVVKNSYTIHQNRVLFDSFVEAANRVLGEKGFTLATVGTLGAFTQFFCSMEIGGETGFNIGKGDKWQSFFNLVSSHNGLVASSIHMSNVRIVCFNTVQASIANLESELAIRHTKNSLALVTPEAFESALCQWVKAKAAFKAMLEIVRGQSMTLDGFRAFAAGLFTNDGSDSLSTTSFNRVSEMEILFQRGKGNKGETVYDGLNAITEYFTSGNGVGSSKVTLAKRVASANFGRGADWKREAIRIVSDEREFKVAMERGQRLYGEKLKLIASGN